MWPAGRRPTLIEYKINHIDSVAKVQPAVAVDITAHIGDVFAGVPDAVAVKIKLIVDVNKAYGNDIDSYLDFSNREQV